MSERIVIAFGGNIMLRSGEDGSVEKQLEHVEEICEFIVAVIRERYSVVVTHGNGPQVGEIMLKDEIAKKRFPPMPMDICGAESQGMIGYMIQRYTVNQLKLEKQSYSMNFPVITVVTQTLVDACDPAFRHPTKPIGPYYTAQQARQLEKEKSWQMVRQQAGYRRLVPSPAPIDLVESLAIRTLFAEGWIIIAAGGGGVPVVERSDGTLHGVEGVVDKDNTAALLGNIVDAETLLILTGVDRVALNYDEPDEKKLDSMTVEEAKRYLGEGHFPEGSMGPKVAAAVKFIEGGGRRAIITSLGHGLVALKGEAGTTIVQ